MQITLSPVSGHPESAAGGTVDLLFGPVVVSELGVARARSSMTPGFCVRRRGEPLPRTRKEYLAMTHIAVQIEPRAFRGKVEKALNGARRRIQVTLPTLDGGLVCCGFQALVCHGAASGCRSCVELMPLEWGCSAENSAHQSP